MYLSVGRRAKALIKIARRMPQNPQTDQEVAVHNRLFPTYNAHVKAINPRIDELNKVFFEFMTAYADMVKTLQKMEKELKPLYESGEIKPQPLATGTTVIALGEEPDPPDADGAPADAPDPVEAEATAPRRPPTRPRPPRRRAPRPGSAARSRTARHASSSAPSGRRTRRSWRSSRGSSSPGRRRSWSPRRRRRTRGACLPP
jgi:hypothetical protein